MDGIDAGFLYMETTSSPMHVASLMVLDPSTSPDGFSFDKLRDLYALVLSAGKTTAVRFNLNAKARALFKDTVKRKVTRKNGRKKVKKVKVSGLKSLRSQVLIGGKSAGFITVQRTGKVS